MGQGIAQIFRMPIGALAGLGIDTSAKAVLRTVRLVRHHDDVLPLAHGRQFVLALGCREFLDGGEDHSARGSIKLGAKIIAAVGLDRFLPDKVAAHRERAEQLIVQIVAVGDDDDGGVFQSRIANEQASVESHQQAFARSLSMPDHAYSLIARRLSGLTWKAII